MRSYFFPITIFIFSLNIFVHSLRWSWNDVPYFNWLRYLFSMVAFYGGCGSICNLLLCFNAFRVHLVDWFIKNWQENVSIYSWPQKNDCHCIKCCRQIERTIWNLMLHLSTLGRSRYEFEVMMHNLSFELWNCDTQLNHSTIKYVCYLRSPSADL